MISSKLNEDFLWFNYNIKTKDTESNRDKVLKS